LRFAERLQGRRTSTLQQNIRNGLLLRHGLDLRAVSAEDGDVQARAQFRDVGGGASSPFSHAVSSIAARSTLVACRSALPLSPSVATERTEGTQERPEQSFSVHRCNLN
jgi:hypothetical protein